VNAAIGAKGLLWRRRYVIANELKLCLHCWCRQGLPDYQERIVSTGCNRSHVIE
jgi:hypothetical protein